MSNNPQNSKEYWNALNQAKELITKSQEKFLRSETRINMEVRLNLGKIIDEHSVKHDWGKSILKNFSKDLSIAFPGNTGFSERNLSSMRQFYYEYNKQAELLELAKDVSWGTNIAIM